MSDGFWSALVIVAVVIAGSGDRIWVAAHLLWKQCKRNLQEADHD